MADWTTVFDTYFKELAKHGGIRLIREAVEF